MRFIKCNELKEIQIEVLTFFIFKSEQMRIKLYTPALKDAIQRKNFVKQMIKIPYASFKNKFSSLNSDICIS